jgi:diguanylate cyclase (GGDEF)-like protein/PAS domain S-box-containing protein
MSSCGVPSPPADLAGAHLRSLVELTRLVRGSAPLDKVLESIASVISERLGFATVVINLYRPESDEYEVTTVCGSAEARGELLGDVVPARSWAPMLDPRFFKRGVFFVPAGAVEWDPEIRSFAPERPVPEPDTIEVLGGEAWQPDDALFVSLDSAGGRHYGIIAVDEPISGLRPDNQLLDVLVAAASHAGVAIESAAQNAELRSTLRRHEVLLASALDAVIAIDSHGLVIEFNPSAERMFGYASQDAVGRELAELIVAPEEREAHRRGVARAFGVGDWRLLDRRMEMTAVRADGSRLPTELTLTLVEGTEDSGPIVYGFLRDISERRRGEEQLAYLAYHDPLTSLPNRILVEQQLALALARARRTSSAVALMFLDLDDFKEINDKLGHAAGDQILTAVATRLRGVLRDSDVLARHGGDEFLVLLSDLETDPVPAAEAVAGKLHEALREPFVVAGNELRTGASIGISLYPDDAEDTEALLRHADAAMYRAKAAGGGRVAFHRPAESILARRASVSAQLHRAIQESELELHYQPIWTVGGTRRITGVEALLRWQHPDRGLLRPDAFINLAESSAVGEELMAWALRDVCRQAAEWERIGLVPRISLNISPNQLLTPIMAERFSDEVAGFQLDAARFMIELTESAWTVDAARTLAVMAELRAAGAVLAIDDFGAGYSSLSRLRELDFDVIKTDPRLMADVPEDHTAVAVLRAIVDLAGACQAEIISEGVESEAQVAFLNECGIGQAQGFLFGHPLRADEITPLLERRLAQAKTTV